MLPPDLMAFLDGLSVEDRKVVLAMRKVVRRTVPQAEESLLWGGLSYHRPEVGGRVKGAVCQIGVKRGQVRLDFIHGVRLSDPWGLLQGDRLSKRFIPIDTAADAERQEIVALIREAATLDPSEWANEGASHDNRPRGDRGADVAAIRDIFLATYGTDYTDPRYYDDALLTRLVYSDDSLLLVAEDTETGQVAGTASVDLEVGAHSDLVGEFCRLAVHPTYRNRGIGKILLSERLQRVQDRLQVGLVEARATHPYSLKIAEAHQFAVVGFLPERWRLRERESLALLVRYFGDALELRNNHPRVIPEVHALAHMALENCSLPQDAIVDEDAPAYPPGGDFDLQELTTEGYAALLRIERGRVRHREIFGPARLHYGIFRLQARHSRYLIAREDGRIAGAVGFTLDPVDKAVRIFELIALHDEVIRFLLTELERACREEWDCLIEVDVSAHAPGMQRTLIELGFLPVAYLPALVFHEVERLDVVKMVRLLSAPKVRTDGLTPSCAAFAELVLRLFRNRTVLPRIAKAVHNLPLFAGLSEEQVARLAGVCGVTTFEPGDPIFREGEAGNQMHVVLQGEVEIAVAASVAPVGVVRHAECLGEMSLLTAAVHSATATARTRVETAVLGHQDLAELIRRRPDIGLHLYKNLAVGMGAKLKRVDVSLAQPAT